jgi:DNA-binding response OmpR family regulator
VSRALAAGAADYLVKPFDPEELAVRLARLERAGR